MIVAIQPLHPSRPESSGPSLKMKRKRKRSLHTVKKELEDLEDYNRKGDQEFGPLNPTRLRRRQPLSN